MFIAQASYRQHSNSQGSEKPRANIMSRQYIVNTMKNTPLEMQLSTIIPTCFVRMAKNMATKNPRSNIHNNPMCTLSAKTTDSSDRSKIPISKRTGSIKETAAILFFAFTFSTLPTNLSFLCLTFIPGTHCCKDQKYNGK